MNNDYYYNVEKDLNKYPDNWLYIIIGGRNTGKTYSTLKFVKDNRIKFVFVKRTVEDVDLICSNTKSNKYSFDLSPFKSINRDFNSNIRAFKIFNGLGGFWNCDDENEPVGDPIGYICALSIVQKLRGFDLSECDYIIFDEFIPQPWERVSRKEGEQIMELYKTVGRDREHRGKEALKLIALANATKASNPLCNIVEVTDDIVDMVANEIEYNNNDRNIFIRILKNNEIFDEVEKNSKIYNAMNETAWGQVAFNNKFGYDDFSEVKKVNINRYKCLLRFKYKKDWFYLYYNDKGYFYVCTSASKHFEYSYNLNRESQQKAFYQDWVYKIQDKTINGRCSYRTYTPYDLIMNYKKNFYIY